jgi:hypothetical protein
MQHCYRRCRNDRARLGRAFLLVAACAVVLAFGSTARADDPARVRDEVFGDVQVLLWSEGHWALNGGDIGCVTFVGGTSTGPGNTYNIDSIVCDPTPTDWHWSVILPNGATLEWGVDDIPPEVQVCAQIFYSLDHPALIARASVEIDRLLVVDGLLNSVLYNGPLSTFDPEAEGFIPTQGQRCGVIIPLATGACCFADGRCEILYQDACTEAGGTYLGDGLACEPNNPCPPPPMACCFQDGHCEFLTADSCTQLGGVPQGYGSVCEPNPCPQPPDTGACCLDDQGNCQVLTEPECLEQGGEYQGDDTTCDPNPCPIVPIQNVTWGRIKATYR